MITATDTVSTMPVTAQATDRPLPLNAQYERELDRLAGNLLSSLTGVHPFCLLMMELGEGRNSSRWLATGVASVLGERLNRTVHVLSLAEGRNDRRSSSSALRPADAGTYVLESIATRANGRGESGTLAARLESLRETRQPVLLHLSDEQGLTDLLPCAEAIDGVVLLVRASRTRKASLHEVERQLSRAGMKALGCVLLDRVHPIPEKLYRLL